MNGQAIGYIGAILGTLLGVGVGLFGTYATLRNVRGPRERAFVMRASVACWALVIAFVVAMWLVPPPYKHWLWLPYVVILVGGVLVWNRQQDRIRREEAGRPASP